MSFDYKKVILKDYTTVFNTLVALMAIEVYRKILSPGDDSNAITIFSIILAILIFLVAAIQLYKKKDYFLGRFQIK